MIFYDETSFGIDEKAFRKSLINWGRINFRPFPWRYTDNPYYILCAELLLHRTQAKQVEPVYLEFIRKFPDLKTLYTADREAITALVKTLGLFWRSNLILDAAFHIMEKYAGEIPVEREALLSIPGIGHYIAGAIRCFAYGQPDSIIDTNVVRVVIRVLGIHQIDSLRRNKSFMLFVEQLVDPVQPKEFNFALLDLANSVCTPRDPNCPTCPLVIQCLYGQARLKQ